MAKTNPSTIVLKAQAVPHFDEFPLAALDASGNGGITPGMLVEIVNGEVRPHSTQAGNADRLFAVEGQNLDPLSYTLGNIDVDYDDDGCAVKVWYPQSGDVVYALLGAGQQVAVDGYLQSASDGYLMAYAAGGATPERIVGRAVAAVDNSAEGTPARVKVKVA